MVHLTSKRLSEEGFAHGFTTRVGGADFQVKPGDPASRARVDAHVRGLAAELGFDPGALYEVTQVHGATVVRAEGDRDALRAVEADALVAFPGGARATPPTSGPARSPAIAVRVADCLPLLLADRETGAVAAIHAGWRGVVAGVVRAGATALSPRSPSSIVAAIGPCIGPCCFEVGADVAEAIANAAGDAGVIARNIGKKAYVDLRRAVRAQLLDLGVAHENVDDVPGCTRCDAVRFHSFRRDGGASGRHLALIVPRGEA